MTLYDTKKTVDPEEYNQGVRDTRAKYGGCVSSRACEECGAVIADSICLCVGVFTCPRCGHENGSAIKELWKTLDERQNTDLYLSEQASYYGGEVVFLNKTKAGKTLDKIKEVIDLGEFPDSILCQIEEILEEYYAT